MCVTPRLLPPRTVVLTTGLHNPGYYVIGLIITIAFALITIFHKQIVNWLQPTATKIRE